MKLVPTKDLIDGVRRALKKELDMPYPDPKSVRYLSTSLLRLETVLQMEIAEGRARVAYFGDMM